MKTGFTSGTLKLIAILQRWREDRRLGLEGLAVGKFLGVLELLVKVAAGGDEIGDGE